MLIGYLECIEQILNIMTGIAWPQISVGQGTIQYWGLILSPSLFVGQGCCANRSSLITGTGGNKQMFERPVATNTSVCDTI